MRNLKNEEHDLILFMLKDNPAADHILDKISESKVQVMDDGGMGSLKFLYHDKKLRSFFKEIANVSIMDIDKVPVSFAINIDGSGDLFELDVFKGDFSALKQFPTPPYDTIPDQETS